MSTIVQQLMRFARDEDGVTAIEYGLIAALIALLIIAGVTSIGQTLSDIFNDIATSI
ncbi:Flp family type IVb pilin [Burkholderia guangdongensis]|uniref:Flp family type IVb pilin n=1 Tax=Burkholderia guangdongensis TaxID=1792500 RepID=UPI0015CEEFB4|nr:Flp family type IVb pilin [Burkholderia guangdongensis]